jgi:hypothetical protein
VNIKSAFIIAVCALLGLVAGYAIFGKLAGSYVSMDTLLSFGGNAIQSAFRSISGIEAMRNKILLCGATGVVTGVLLAFTVKK